MRLTRVAAAATSLLLLGASTTIGSAGAASTGVGTSNTSTTVLDAALGNAGSLLDVQLLTDSAQSSIDSKTGAVPVAYSKLTAAQLSSQSVSALGFTTPGLEARQPGGAADVNNAAIDLSAPAGVALPAGFPTVLSGTIDPAHLTATVSDGVKSSLTEALSKLSVAGGLLSANAVNNTSGTDSGTSAASSTRSATIDAVTVLDLGALLNGLGIPLPDLTIAQADGLISTLKTTVTGLDPAMTLQQTFDAVQSQITTLEAAITSATDLINGDATSIIDTTGLGGIIDTSTITTINGITTGVVDQTQAVIDALQAGLADLLGNALTALDAAPLLKLNGVDISVATKAADTVANSAATVTAKIGSISVGSVTIPGVDLLATADQINGTITTVTNTISGALNSVGVPVGSTLETLTGIVKIGKLLDPTHSVTSANGYTVANAGLTALSVTVTPPVDLSAIVSGVLAQVSGGTAISSLITTAGGTVPTLDTAMTTFNGLLGTGVTALGAGATVKAVQVLGNSEFKVVAAPTSTGGTLPLTGSNALRLAALGVLLVALGLGLGRWLDMPMPAFLKVRR